jgi:hypothetical protein
MLTNNPNPNAHKTEPAVVLIVTCCTDILVVRANTCPVVAMEVHALVYEKPPST